MAATTTTEQCVPFGTGKRTSRDSRMDEDFILDFDYAIKRRRTEAGFVSLDVDDVGDWHHSYLPPPPPPRELECPEVLVEHPYGCQCDEPDVS